MFLLRAALNARHHSGWRNDKYVVQWFLHVFAVFDDERVDQIETADAERAVADAAR